MTIILNSSQVQQNFGQAVDRAMMTDDVIVERYGTPRVAIVEYTRYQKLIEAERQRARTPATLATPAMKAAADSSDLAGYRHITRVPGVCGGRPIVQGTRTPVKAIVGYHKLGLSADDILTGLPHLTPAQVYEALSFYHDHQAEIEQEIAEDQRVLLSQQYGLQVAADGRVLSVGQAQDA